MSAARRLSPDEILDQLHGSTTLAPGVWADREGGLHFSIPDILAAFGLPDTPATRNHVTAMLRAAIAELAPGLPVVEQKEPES